MRVEIKESKKIFMHIVRRSDCVPLPIVVCPVVAVVMLESWVARCVHCVENVACRQFINS